MIKNNGRSLWWQRWALTAETKIHIFSYLSHLISGDFLGHHPPEHFFPHNSYAPITHFLISYYTLSITTHNSCPCLKAR